MKVDYCFLEKDLKCKKYERLVSFRKAKPTSSDHVPLMYDVEV